ncbi:hypothetical protein HCO69_19545 [Pantoea sp. LS15]|uniref:C2H2-type zinc finger protein n=1 Tax=Enterobacterales TaxID=91347 RepID=UPI000E0F9D03|nr:MULTISPECIES: C2H2-type zinc finger protein [Enterobacterales]NJQ21807.1 hypothetical protein [Pantoea sp. LS15]NKF48403.1 hypothetical protein [Pantoea sp. LS15]RDK12961.1 hypothetical protein CEJ32_20005 [Enterobacter sp. 9-2]
MSLERKTSWLADKFEKMGPQRLECLLLNWKQPLLLPAEPSKELYYSLARQLILAAEETDSARKVLDLFGPYPMEKSTLYGDNVCYQCKKSFTCEDSYIAHQRVVHRKEFFCDYCKKAYIYRDDLDKHHKTSHGLTLQHVCFICFDSFRTERGLINHYVLAKHGMTFDK